MEQPTFLHRQEWMKLPEDAARLQLEQLVKERLPGFTVKSFQRFERFDQSNYTAILDFEGAEFVFVPGDTVTLGFDPSTLPFQHWKDLIAPNEWEDTDIKSYIQERFSPVRQVTISPMIVEREAANKGYFEVPLDDERLTSEESYAKVLKEVRETQRENYSYNIAGRYEVRKRGDEISAWLYFPASHQELVEEITASGFRLPTEDEWEYLCGGGSRTVYPWGNKFLTGEKNHHFSAEHDKNTPFFLDLPNHFGLTIANDPYKLEVMMDSEWFLKAGDSGCNICGGAPMELGYLPVSTYYREPYIFEPDMEYKEEITGNYTFLRRIIRL
ncbi:sulfatase-modifying factor enzyme 1 [Chitinophaga dinghuensis]|uniref:Sulfatase-modifying factor enzyme 1 n=1 Tax=Chitinophaga dinghuensis TaxID=1539050 RepID=A0A327W641_9BACT|nr:SUMF1/EgtB/PvdO family nonheme iron enzyme [Chitinophaga dinghuensis]RAJ83635.1 sulfatase-modifying factor enzyme 1 [Chitinophaga dinghuensis]